jgi:hypothetical protein
VPPVPHPRQHLFAQRLAGALPPPAPPPGPGVAAALPAAAVLPELVTLVGVVDGTIANPGTGTNWVLVYRDWRMTTWFLVESTGILHFDTVPEDGDPDFARDVVWVTRDTAVGRGSGPQSDEARFLTGQFVRAGDFDQWETGGQSSAETGLYCPNTPLCNCGPRSRG